jgi:hypothetical protein
MAIICADSLALETIHKGAPNQDCPRKFKIDNPTRIKKNGARASTISINNNIMSQSNVLKLGAAGVLAEMLDSDSSDNKEEMGLKHQKKKHRGPRLLNAQTAFQSILYMHFLGKVFQHRFRVPIQCSSTFAKGVIIS